MGKPAVAIDLTAEERQALEGLAGRRRTAQGLARRARIVLLAEGLENKEICTVLAVDPNTVGKWRRRYAERRFDGLLDELRPGRPREIGDDEIAETIRLTLETTPLVQPTGRCVPWLGRWAMRPRRFTGFGKHSVCSRTASKPSSFRRTRCLSKRCGTSLGST